MVRRRGRGRVRRRKMTRGDHRPGNYNPHRIRAPVVLRISRAHTHTHTREIIKIYRPDKLLNAYRSVGRSVELSRGPHVCRRRRRRRRRESCSTLVDRISRARASFYV